MSTPAKRGSFSLGRLIARLRRTDIVAAVALQKIETAVNTVADNTASSAVGRLGPPPPINGVTVKTSGEMLHIQINHNAAIQQGIHYFSEISTSQDLSNPLVIHHGTSRTSHPISLPTFDDNGVKQNYYLQSYAQYPGSDPTPVMKYPSPITMDGTTKMTLLASTGSGTASNTGSQAGWGFGKIQRRA